MNNKNIQFKQKLIDKNISYTLIGDYTHSKTKTEFYCEKHNHIFLARPNCILSNKKCCDFCKKDMNCFAHDKESFNLILNNSGIKYYIIGEYKNRTTWTTFYCEEHGEFDAIPRSVLNKTKKCPHCSGKIIHHTTETFNNKLKTNGIKYTLVSNYIDAKTESLFYCEKHGEFLSTPNCIMNGSNTCKLCRTSPPRTDWSLESLNEYLEFNNRNLIFHDYIGVATKSPCTCKICNHTWNTKPKNILYGSGCRNCAKCTFNFNSPAILYYIQISHDNQIYYKIGITNKIIKKRFSGDLHKIQVLFEKQFDVGINAFNEEQKILKEFKDYRYNGEPILKSGGNTEIFIQDVFKGYYENV